MNKKDYRYFKQQLKQGYKITFIYDRMASTGEIATTYSNFKDLKHDIKRLRDEGIRFAVRITCNKYKIIQNIHAIIAKISEEADLIGEDTIWHDYIKQLNKELFDLSSYI